MIWGKTDAQKRRERNKSRERKVVFAWLPVEIADGRRVWLQRVVRVWAGERVLSAGWADDPEPDNGTHWWVFYLTDQLPVPHRSDDSDG